MLEFLAISPHNPHQQEFRDFLSLLEGVNVSTVNDIQNAKAKIFYNKPSVLFVHLTQITERSLQGIEQIRSPFDLPVIIFTSKISDTEIELTKKFKRYYILGRPFLARDVLGIAYKMIQNTVPKQQVQRRYTTNQSTELQVVGTDSNVPAKIINLSLTGAKINLDIDSDWSEGDLIKMNIPLSKLKKQHSVHAKVVWVEQIEEDHQIGVEFIPTEDVYSHLLSNV